jgi:hypothetical protein
MLDENCQDYLIRHRYEIGDQGVSVRAPEGFDARRAAVYMQFNAERWFGPGYEVTNLGVAAGLVMFYGCEHEARRSGAEVIDMYSDREKLCGISDEVTSDAALHRDGLREFLQHHVQDCMG